MGELPIIETERLKLRPYILDDVPELKRLIGERDIASTTLNIPHPYEDGIAEEWMRKHQENFEKGAEFNFAIVERTQGLFIGGISLDAEYEQDEIMQLGYWIGKPYWNRGYCTEAARAVIKYGFEVLGLNRIYARHFTRNPASGRIMQKIGMKHEGTARQAVKKWDKFEDIEYYGILKSDYFKIVSR